ncbi:hypothetical protein ABZ686_01115 [Streptomyces sp. NPDC006992]|uniref:hypothetical protein n=1 Tax=unclassified Streptomyces TaxID=2593676 RepID=UPI0033EE1AD2
MDSTVRYVDGEAHTSTVTIPGAQGPLAGDYSWRYFYNAETGTRTGFPNPQPTACPRPCRPLDLKAHRLISWLTGIGIRLRVAFWSVARLR